MSSDSSPRLYSLPLFPLHTVLFPHFTLQLHIFEERYRVMIAECMEKNAPFGVVLIQEGTEAGAPATPYEVGCVARILAVKNLEDGRMLLIAGGDERFRVLEYFEAELPYLVGRVETLCDGPRSGLDAEAQLDDETLMDDSKILLDRYLHVLAERVGIPLPEVEFPPEIEQLGLFIAAVAQMPAIEKQKLLEMTDSVQRLEAEKDFLQEQIEALESIPDDPSSDAEPTEASIQIALPIDTQDARWKQYRGDSRN